MIVIYALIDPRTRMIRYVGKAENLGKRLCEHLSDKRKSPRVSWFQVLKTAGLSPEVEVLEQFQDNEEWQEAERFWIAYLRSIGCPLTNLDSGGRGGTRRSPETRAQISAARKGMVFSPEHRRNIRIAKLGLGPLSVEHRANISAALKGKKNTPEHCEHIRNTRLGRKRGPETVEKLRAAAIKQNQIRNSVTGQFKAEKG